MNQRIKELAEQASLDNIDRISAVIDVEKFAELIVRECIEQLDDGDSDTNSNYWAIKRVKAHFGVEE